MRHRNLVALIALSTCGCQSEPINPVVWIANRLTQTHCVARKISPGSKWIDHDNGGGWVRLGEDGKIHPIAPPDEKVTPSPDPLPEQDDRNR